MPPATHWSMLHAAQVHSQLFQSLEAHGPVLAHEPEEGATSGWYFRPVPDVPLTIV